ncbi:hypothetical protein TWF481_009552 [Arthrobotrys musiformis]|uniref:HNH nuclease domain-containing protein n=1 Tax=Arthrobotrys musiformis TaxID=47236 RepID=A0AAV9W527_9PEZI
MASHLSDLEENLPVVRRIPHAKILPYVASSFQRLKETDPRVKISNITGLYQEYEQGPELFLGEDFSPKIAALVDKVLKKYGEEVKVEGVGEDARYNRYELFESILRETTVKGRGIFVFSIFLAVAMPTVFREEGMHGLGDFVEAVEGYVWRVGESMEVVWEGLDCLADSLVMQLVVPMYRTAGIFTPENVSALQDGDGCVLPGMKGESLRTLQDFQLAVLERDRNTCMVTGRFDTDAEIGTTSSVHRVAHILPWILNWDRTCCKETKNRFAWNLLDIFDANSSSRLSDSLSINLDSLGNGLTLDRRVHRHFEGLQLWFEFEMENEAENIYKIVGKIDGSLSGSSAMPIGKRVAFKKGKDYPARRLLDIHAKISRIAHVSGAIGVCKEYIGKKGTSYIEHAPDHKSAHPGALKMKLLSITGPDANS